MSSIQHIFCRGFLLGNQIIVIGLVFQEVAHCLIQDLEFFVLHVLQGVVLDIKNNADGNIVET